MADRFFDTSAAVKHYHPELGTAKVDALLAEAGARHFLSDLAVVEFHSVLARLVRTGTITVTTSEKEGQAHFLKNRYINAPSLVLHANPEPACGASPRRLP